MNCKSTRDNIATGFLYKTIKRWLCLIFTIFCSCLFLFCSAQDILPINWNEEEKIHPDKIEWWYHYGFLKSSSSGNPEWAFFCSFIRSWSGRCLIYKVTDLSSGRNYKSLEIEKTLRSLALFPRKEIKFLNLSSVQVFRPDGSIDLEFDRNVFRKKNDYSIRLESDSLFFSSDILLDSSAVPMLMEGTGKIGIKNPEKFYYYTFPALSSSGKLKLGSGDTLFLSGDVWYDHQWGDPLSHANVASWRWWGIRLETGESFNIYYIKDMNEKVLKRVANRQDKDGNLVFSENIKCIPHRFWKSPKTGILYPVEWSIELPEWNYDFYVSPMFDDHEMPILIYKYFWEGPCKVTVNDRTTHAEINSGTGYQELVGYAFDKLKEKVTVR